VIPEIVRCLAFRFIVIDNFALAIRPQSLDEEFRCSGNDVWLLQNCVGPRVDAVVGTEISSDQ
jgi:hypothetical protein